MNHDLPSPGRFAKRALWVAAFVAIWVALLRIPSPAFDRYLDQGYGLALAWFFRSGKQAGVDYVFTYGPLGYLVTGTLYFPGLFAVKLAATGVFEAAAAVVLVRFATHLPAWLGIAWLAFALAFLPQSETELLLVPVVAALLLVVEDDWSPARVVATTLLLAALALAKFTFLVLATCLVAALASGAPRARRARLGALVAGAYAASFAALWLLARQSLWNVPRYLALSYEVANGYSEAMSFRGSDSVVTAGLWTIAALAGGALCVPLRAWRSRRRRTGLLLLAPGLFTAWKEAFVRQDPQHARVFFHFVVFAALALVALDRGRRFAFPRTAALSLLAGTWAVGYATWNFPAGNMRALEAPRRYARACEAAWREQQHKWALPAVKARVGDASIDVTSFDQNIVFWNDFNWKPRPIFQGYSAYTPALAELNARFARVPAGPRFMLVRWNSIDRRFPAEDDGPLLVELFHRYRPVLDERDYILLERLPDDEDRTRPARVVLDARVRFGQVLRPRLDTRDLCTMQVRFHPTALGRVRGFLFRTPRPYFDVQQGDRTLKRYELVSALGSAPFVLSPLCEGNVDIPRIYAGGGRRVAGFRFVADREVRSSFEDRVDVLVRCSPGALP